MPLDNEDYDLKAHYHMAANTVELLRKGIAAGKSAQDMISQDLLQDWAPKWGNLLVGSADWIGQAY